jgi:hypothetical protein
MDPISAVNLGLGVLDAALKLINEIRSQSGMTADQLIAHADAQDLANKEQIKALLAS